MKKPKIYIETTMFNYYFDCEREAHLHTVKLFEELRSGRYEPYTSEYVLQELRRAPEPKRGAMLRLIGDFEIAVFDVDAEAERLADVYVAEKVLPEKYRMDGLHIALTAVKGLEFIVSLNFKHIVKRRTLLLTEVINTREGYRRVGIFSPMEVVEDDGE